MSPGLIPASYSGKMCLFDGAAATFRTVKLRGRQKTCRVCGPDATIKTLDSSEYVEAMCGRNSDKTSCGHVNELSQHERVSCAKFAEIRGSGWDYVLIDVREPIEWQICHLDESVNVPWSCFDSLKGSMQVSQLVSEAGLKQGMFVLVNISSLCHLQKRKRFSESSEIYQGDYNVVGFDR